jgi:aspartate/methionine/tyrosine aminotransferase
VAEHYLRTYGVAVSPDQVLVTAGTSPAMLLLFTGLLQAGDEVILSDPHYACYPNLVRFADGVPVYLPTSEAEGWRVRPEAVAGRLTPRTRAVMVNSPANPTGVVTPPGELQALAAAVEGTRDAFLVSDEIYHGLSYGAPDHTVLEYTDRAFVLNGFSKAYAMTGWRLGYLIAPKSHIGTLQRLHGNFFISSNEFVQWAGVAALRECSADVARFRAEFDRRRRVTLEGLAGLGLHVRPEPTGAFYALADARHLGPSSYDLAFHLLAGSHVALTPGIDFGPRAEGYLRLSYANSVERLTEAFRRIGEFLPRR